MALLPSGEDLVALIEAAHAQLELAKGLTVVSLTLLIYDWAICFHLEVTYIWKAPWTYSRLLYHLNRIWPVVLLGIALPVFLFHPSPSPSVCRQVVSLYAYGCLIAIDIVSGTLIFRCWALYNSRPLLWILLIGLACAATSTILIANSIIRRAIFMPQIFPGVLSGCTVIIPPGMWIALIPTTVFETFLFILTVWKLRAMMDHLGITRLTQKLVEHGIIYFAIRVILIVFACIGGDIRAVQIATNASGLLTSVSSVVCSRMIFSLYELDGKLREGAVSAVSDEGSCGVLEWAIPLVSIDVSLPNEPAINSN